MQSCALIILAAGSSRRMGQAKQLLRYKGRSLVAHCCHTALEAEVEPIILVTGANSSLVKKEVVNPRINVVENQGWEEGIASSIRCGLDVLMETEPDTESVILMVCDQPFVTSDLIDELIEANIDTEKEIIACSYGDTIGTPVLFSKEFFPLLLELQGDEGAKKILRQYSDTVGTISFPSGVIDIDTIEDYNNLPSN